MIQINAKAYKSQTNSEVVIDKSLHFLKKFGVKKGKDIYSFKECRRVWGWLMHLDREETNRFIVELRDMGKIQLVPFHGVILKTKDGEEK